ncbi:hypothetical protein ORV05_04830 [Amycolatopsis cynarae]|uniref:MerR family transcriptional regulator n=1 Tax=Amycolatopsis cynarae TaxID=2995223 RepID=A0ABY7B4K5_9PSEU|nr:hypothetical protein [Amycolatopsis sp. HUAS 11-8]WAL67116.1 hypothetical protein ORV05_04830 [Amycolatopsis sp. HUAS 11-8]
MSHTCACRSCDRLTHDEICPGCTGELVDALRALAYTEVDDRRPDAAAEAEGIEQYRPGLVADLLDVVTRQTRFSTGIGVIVRAAETPIPPDLKAAALLHTLTTDVGAYATAFARHHPHLRPRLGSVADAAAWMADFPGLLAAWPGVEQVHAAITSLVARVRRVVDRPAELHCLGRCTGCKAPLYARADKPVIRCRCGRAHDVAFRRQWLLAEAADQLGTAIEIARALSSLLARPVSVDTIRGWAARGRLAARPPHPHDPRGHPTYRVGDVTDLVLAAAQRGKGSAA